MYFESGKLVETLPFLLAFVQNLETIRVSQKIRY
jgi:hypothetical protein